MQVSKGGGMADESDLNLDLTTLNQSRFPKYTKLSEIKKLKIKQAKLR